MKTREYFSVVSLNLVRRWEIPEPRIEFDDDSVQESCIPIKFCDGLARAFFIADLTNMLYRTYRMGVRDEQKRRKKKAVRKYMQSQKEGDD